MNAPSRPFDALRARYEALQPEWRERLPAIALALAIEVLLILLLISLGSVKREIAEMSETLVAFTSPAREEAADEPPAPQPEEVAEIAEQQPAPVPPEQPQAEQRRPLTPPLPVPRPVPRSTFSIENLPREAPPVPDKPQAYGPAFTPSSNDTPRVAGSGPNGEPLYAARWYREPYNDELAGYLSTARGPGWGMIDCRTVPNFRVEDCVIVGEAPEGSGIGAAVLAAAWQFKVRPPQRGGRPLVGEWVRIRIDYSINRVRSPEERYGN